MRTKIIMSSFLAGFLVMPIFAQDGIPEVDIKETIKHELMWDSRVQQENVKVTVDDNEVTLRGIVNSATARAAAETNAWEVSGVYDVNNLLVVSYGEDYIIPTDQELQARINSLLKWSSTVDSSDISVFTNAGKITLEGTVPSLWQKQKAKELVTDVLGVFSVQNELAIAPDKEYEDQVIADIIVDAVNFEPNADMSNVNINVDDGIVTLSGMVENQQAKVAIGRSAVYTQGVIAVDNNLKF